MGNSQSTSRRNLLKGAAVGAAGLVTAGGFLASNKLLHAHADANTSSDCVTSIADIVTIARTAERLAVTFYTNGYRNADKMGLKGSAKEYIHAALIEEQIHEYFFRYAGGAVIASNFSFPHGHETFTNLKLFIETQQQLEGVFDSAFLAAVKEFSLQSRSDLAQIAAQIACVEAEHRVLGRALGGNVPADNWVYTPVLLAKVGDAPALVKSAGYLSPTSNNNFAYVEANINDPGIVYRTPFSVTCKS